MVIRISETTKGCGSIAAAHCYVMAVSEIGGGTPTIMSLRGASGRGHALFDVGEAKLATVSDLFGEDRRAHTASELIMRKMLHAAGLRFRLHRLDLPGTPNFVLPWHKTAIFVHGRLWRRHSGCRLATASRTRIEF